VTRDTITGLAILAASLALLWATLGLERHPLVPVGPGFYPRIVLGVTAAMALLLVVLDVAGRRKREEAPAAVPPARDARPNYGLVAASFGVFSVYVFVLPYLGFRIATLAFLVALQIVLEPPRNARRWVVVLGVALVATVAVYYAFERYLHVLLPRGLWTDF
jgi:putative tricarboxylic transport membrane protein